MRIVRTCDAVIHLRRNGFGAEAWPLRRAALEHVLALRWLAIKGDEAKDVIIRAHAHTGAKRRAASAGARWESAEWAVWERVADDGRKATGNVSESNMLTNMTARIDTYGHPSDLASWLMTTQHSHPGWETAAPYIETSPPTFLTEPKFDGSLGDNALAVGYLLRALESIGEMCETPPWAEVLAEADARYQRLQEALPMPPDPSEHQE